MSNLINFKGQKVASAFAHLDPNKDLGGGIQTGFPILGYRGKNLTLRYQSQIYPFRRDDDGSAQTFLDAIIVGVADNISKVYYPPGDFDEDATDGPLCASVGGVTPDPGVPEPQSRACATCKNNAWTTLPNGGRGKLCQDHKRLALLLMPTVTKKMLGAPLLEPVYLKVPPGSLTSLKAYSDALRHEGFPFAAVLTRISFSPDKLFRMVFEAKQPLTDKEAPLVLPLIDDPRTKRIIGEEPEIREVKPAITKAPEPVLIETGIVEAFAPESSPAPAKAAPVEIEDEDEGVEILPPEPKKQRRQKASNGASAVEAATEKALQGPIPGEEDTELSDEIAGLLDRKIENMLK